MLLDVHYRVMEHLDKQEPNAFAFAYEKMGTSLGGVQLRYNYYPMITRYQ